LEEEEKDEMVVRSGRMEGLSRRMGRAGCSRVVKGVGEVQEKMEGLEKLDGSKYLVGRWNGGM
jgi:hypothetical protein